MNELELELEKAQDEINCAEESLEAFACEFDPELFNQGFECLGDYVSALHTAHNNEIKRISEVYLEVVRAVERKITDVVLRERESCAELCELWNATPGERLAKAIRARPSV
jgi:hypothetical protein